jgi:lysophospholipase L1-like esterase
VKHSFIPFLFAFLFTGLCLDAQPFAGEIRAFRQQDSLKFPPPGEILFVGSSSFHFWQDVNDYFPGYHIINRGFGGSSLPDLIRYAPDIIYPYHPRQVVIYCGENDLAASDTVTAQTVVSRFRDLFSLVREHLPGIPILFVSLKPSPSRSALMPKMVDANTQIRRFLKHQKKASFLDVYSLMLDSDGKPRSDIFRADLLHMNPAGYAIWKKAIEPHLLK